MTECFWCGTEFDGTYYRWLCPSCGAKASCCDPDTACDWNKTY